MSCFKVVETPEAGRILVATRLIKAQEKILTDEAQVTAPIIFSGQVSSDPSFFCIHCFKLVVGNKKCPKCRLPICEKACAKAKTHQADCPVLSDMFEEDEEDHDKKKKVVPSIEERFEHMILASSCLGALRLLRMRRNKHPIGNLVSCRPKDYKLANWEKDVVDMLSGCNIDGQGHPINEDEVINALGVWATNGVKVQRSSTFLPCVALFPYFCLVNHRCNPKAMYIPHFDKDSYCIDARAQTNIQPGEEITIRYTDALATNWERRRACKQKWNFTCGCVRCNDITELSTYASGVYCSQCTNGVLLINNEDTIWTCQQCHYESSHGETWCSILDPLERAKLDCITRKADDTIIEQWLWTAQRVLL